MWGCLLSTWIDPETIGTCHRCEWARESLCHMAALKPRKDTGDLRQQIELIGCTAKRHHDYHGMAILPMAQTGLNFSILAPDSTVSWHRLNSRTLDAFLKKLPETEAFYLTGWLVQMGFFRLPSFKAVFFPCSGSMVCHRSTICPGSGASVWFKGLIAEAPLGFKCKFCLDDIIMPSWSNSHDFFST